MQDALLETPGPRVRAVTFRPIFLFISGDEPSPETNFRNDMLMLLLIKTDDANCDASFLWLHQNYEVLTMNL